MGSEKPKVKTVTGPKAAVATFVRPRDKVRIYVFTKRGESIDDAIKRVMQHNQAEGQNYERIK